ncbi:aldo/keto reductase [Sphingomonas asaccharolytica]|uniref:aldo/keto reductase n=1 Tax=Sphingomonas asaccharolytica TaxID=40681 RepID=UPI00083765EF|nr:aldo/keto reductase [Sphingomonas asaccharolytica]
MIERPSAESRPLGKSGILVSPIAWGMWRLRGDDVAGAHALIEAALDSGITLFDTADIYGFNGTGGFGDAESALGRVLGEAPELRASMVVATKGGIIPGVPYDSSPAYLDRALDASLRRLGVEQVDLWQVHRPDLLAHPQELAATLEKMIASGKTRAVGVSNFTPAQVAALESFLTIPLASTQPEFSPLHTDPLWDGTLDLAMARDHAVLAWSPLGGGRLGQDGPVAALLAGKGAQYGVSAAAAAYAWLMAHPARVIPIVGSQRVERIREARDAFEVEWTRAEWYAVLQASMGKKLP